MAGPVRSSGGFLALVLAGLALVAGACATPGPPEPKSRVRPSDAAFLPSPLATYPRSLSASEAEALRAAHASLMAGESAMAVEDVCRRLLAANPGLEPAQILWAQADFVRGSHARAFERGAGVAAEHPAYVAAQLVTGRAAEKLERVRDAYEIYLRVSQRSNLALRRARELSARATEIAAKRTDDLIAKGIQDVRSKLN